ncbi:MAG: adenine phosphoribosyltransferase [Pseudomonadota bacterium]
MKRREFHRIFKSTGPVVLPVIHVLDTPRTFKNIDVLIQSGAPGCFLINHDFGIEPFLPIIRDVRAAAPWLWMGINFLGVTGGEAFPMLGQLSREGTGIDAYWADDAMVDETGRDNAAAEKALDGKLHHAWGGLYFGGTAFKKQREVPSARYEMAARWATQLMDVVTTSGVATGEAADTDKIATFRKGVGETALAVASGITPDNAADYANVDCFMVATGINHKDNFYDIDPARLDALLQVTRDMGKTKP